MLKVCFLHKYCVFACDGVYVEPGPATHSVKGYASSCLTPKIDGAEKYSDIAYSYIRHVTSGKINDKDMRHCRFLKLTCDIGDPPSRAPTFTLSISKCYHRNHVIFLLQVKTTQSK